MKRGMGISLGAAAVCVLTMATTAPSAGAQPQDSSPRSGAGTFQLFEDADFLGGAKSFTASAPDLRGVRWTGTPRPVDNSASSIRNESTNIVWLYDLPHYNGPGYRSPAGSSKADLNSGAVTFENKATSLEFL